MSDQPQPDEWLDIETARQRAGLKSTERIRQLCKENQLIYRKPNYHKIEVTAASLDAWIARRDKATNKAAPPAEVGDLDTTTFGAPDRLVDSGIAVFSVGEPTGPWVAALHVLAGAEPPPPVPPELLTGPDTPTGVDYMNAYEAGLAALSPLERHRMYYGSWTDDDIARQQHETLYAACEQAGAQGFADRDSYPGNVIDVWFADGVRLTYDRADLINLAVYDLTQRLIRDHATAHPSDGGPVATSLVLPTPLPATLGGQHKRTGTPPPQDWQRVAGKCACAGCGHRPMSRHYAGGSLDPRKRNHGRLRCPVCRAAGCNVDHVRCHITIPDRAGDMVE